MNENKERSSREDATKATSQANSILNKAGCLASLFIIYYAAKQLLLYLFQ